MIISAISLTGPESYIIEISADNVPQLLHEFNGDYSLITQYLQILNSRMVLLNPNFKTQPKTKPSHDQLSEKHLTQHVVHDESPTMEELAEHRSDS